MGYVDIENIFENQFKTNSICCVFFRTPPKIGAAQVTISSSTVVAGWWGKGMEGKGHKGGASAQKLMLNMTQTGSF